MSADAGASREFEYIVVGSGAGGGPVAANLAEAGHTVLLLEAGGDPVLSGDNRLPEEYEVPGFHPLASENEAMKWDFYVRHYADNEQQARDCKFIRERDGVLYPRAGTLGGCTAHNAMILVYPHDADWDHIAEVTGDPSWKAQKMRKYFRRMEDCHHRPVWRCLYKLVRFNLTGHGFGGWLTTQKAIPLAAFKDRSLKRILRRSAIEAFKESPHIGERIRWFFRGLGDPNDVRLIKKNAIGIRYGPLSTRDHRRVGSRERVLAVREKHPDKLTIECDALATRVLLDKDNRVQGVEYLKGKRLYRAHSKPGDAAGEKCRALASREVILSGGAFNSPQLLMLSGIGPKKELAKHGIEVRVDLAGVGRNLQDRYEVSVVNRMKKDWQVLACAQFRKGDALYQEWLKKKGAYITNGGVLIVIRRSSASKPLPDLFCLGLLVKFQGYFPGYSKWITDYPNYLSWVVLKAHTLNAAGRVKLDSADPRDPPRIDFHYFDKACDPKEEDLNAVVDGIKFVRTMTGCVDEYIAQEELPGKKVETDEELKQFVRNNAWGHHASCSCAMKPREEGGVVDSKFRVYGTRGLRIVDASVFPKIPGFFIVSSIYMIAEKASEVILEDA